MKEMKIIIAIFVAIGITTTGLIVSNLQQSVQLVNAASCQSLGIPDCHGCPIGSNAFIHSQGRCHHLGAPTPEPGESQQAGSARTTQ